MMFVINPYLILLISEQTFHMTDGEFLHRKLNGPKCLWWPMLIHMINDTIINVNIS
jgi:hypothetical protein